MFVIVELTLTRRRRAAIYIPSSAEKIDADSAMVIHTLLIYLN